jgi:DNA ligase-1
VRRFAEAAEKIRATRSKLEKTRVLSEYLRGLDAADLRLAVLFMAGRALALSEGASLGLGGTALSLAVGGLSGLTEVQLREAFRRHQDPGDWTMEVLTGRTQPEDVGLADVGNALREIRAAEGAASRVEILQGLLTRLDPLAAKYVVKVLTGEMRIGLQEGLVEEAVAQAFDAPLAEVRRAHMLTGDVAEAALMAKAGLLHTAEVELFKPLRFMLASPVLTSEEAMTRVGLGPAWTEEKYDGVRCQLHSDGSRVVLYSRDLHETTAAFPEIAQAAASVPHSILLDGEVLAHREGRVMRFFELQKRLGRKAVSPRMLRDIPVVLVVFDLHALDGVSLMDLPLRERRLRLEALALEPPFLLARIEQATTTEDLDRIFAETRERGNEGLMIKDPLSTYSPGRRGMSWLKLKRPLATFDVVVTAVEWGFGKRKGVLSDYTFAVRDEGSGELVNIGKAYTGLTDREIAEYTERFLAITVEDSGWRRTVRPEVVLEVAFDSIQVSKRHQSGFALRFPRIVDIREDKPVGEIDTLTNVRAVYERFFGGSVSETTLEEVAGNLEGDGGVSMGD